MQKKVLIVDDEDVNRFVLRKIVETEYPVIEANCAEDALELLKEEPCAVILDLKMPGIGGYAFLEEVNKNNSYCNIPIIVATGLNDVENEIKSLKLGAWDFVSKPYVKEIILFRLKNAIQRSSLALMDKLIYLAEHDQLTGLYNRRKFEEVMNERITQKAPFIYLYFDLDNMKEVNDTFSHKIGDLYLIEISRTIEKLLEKNDYVFRVGGDEFVVLLDYLDNYLERVSQFMNSINRLFIINNAIFDGQISVGLTIYPNEANDYEEIIRLGDERMYQMKKDHKCER